MPNELGAVIFFAFRFNCFKIVNKLFGLFFRDSWCILRRDVCTGDDYEHIKEAR